MIAQHTPRELLPKWPADCFDDRPLETLTIPPGNRKVTVCDDYPDCGCMGDCELRPHGIDQAQSLLLLVLVVLAILGLVLIWLGLR
ncbi:MAG: hypothetical protein WBA15_08980 [Mesorhizobium sp.]